MGKSKRPTLAGRTPPSAQSPRSTPPPAPATTSDSSYDPAPQNQINNLVFQPHSVSAPPTSVLPVLQLGHQQRPNVTSPIFNNAATPAVSFPDDNNIPPYPPFYPGSNVSLVPEPQWQLEGYSWHQQHRDLIPQLYHAVAPRTGSTIFQGQDDPNFRQQNRTTSSLFPTTNQFVDPRVLQSTPVQSRQPLGTVGAELLTAFPGLSTPSEERDDMSCSDGDTVVPEPNVAVTPAPVVSPSPSRVKGRGNGKGKRQRTVQAKASEAKYDKKKNAGYEALVGELPIRPTSKHAAFNKSADFMKQLKEDNRELKEENSRLKEENSGLKEENSGLKEETSGLKEENSELQKDKRGLLDTVDRLQREMSELKLRLREDR